MRQKIVTSLFMLALLTAALTHASTIEVSGNITTNTMWTNTNAYLVKGFVYVKSGATLTIQPGTVIYGDKDSKGAVIVEQGAKIMADGTSTQPIVFTSALPSGQRS